MFILPNPKELKISQGVYIISRDSSIVLDSQCNFSDMESARILKKVIREVTGFNLPISKAFTDKVYNNIVIKKIKGQEESYEIKITEEGIEICGADDAGLFYAVQTLCQIIRQNSIEIPSLYIKDAPHFKNRGFYHDVTRGKVPTLKTLKELVDRAVSYKINQIQLYIEHTFVFKNLSEVWVDKDPLTAEEILELDEYCKKRHVELIPSLSTFGHLYEVLRSKSYNELCELEVEAQEPYSLVHRMLHHTLDVYNENSIKLVQEMLREFIPLFSSDKFNICCDETFDLGKGKNAEKVEKLGSGRLYVDFLNKVISCAKGYDKKVMFWGDIILKHPEFLSEIPKDVICLNWGYFASVEENDTRVIAESGLPQYVCPAVTGWNRLMNLMDNAFINIAKMVEYGKKYKALGVLNTDWGDYGHVNLFGNSMPGMIHGAALSWNPEGEKEIDKIDEIISIVEYGKDSKQLMALLRDLSRQQVAHWAHLVFWKEREVAQADFINPWIENLKAIDHNAVAKAHYRALEIQKELEKLSRFAQPGKKLDMEEFIVSAQGIALTEAAFLAIKKYSLGCEEAPLVVDSNKLAVSLEYWLVEYTKLWRERNKESEILRIREIIMSICSFLRDIK